MRICARFVPSRASTTRSAPPHRQWPRWPMPERATAEGLRPLAGRRALVTGASRGIGRAVALALANAARTDKDLHAVAATLEARGAACMPVVCDVTNSAAVNALVAEACERLGGVDVLVNNAGRGRSHAFRDHPDELWDEMLAVNL